MKEAAFPASPPFDRCQCASAIPARSTEDRLMSHNDDENNAACKEAGETSRENEALWLKPMNGCLQADMRER